MTQTIAIAALSPNAYPALVLNADGAPMRLDPLSTMPWQEAVRNSVKGDIEVVNEYDVLVRSPSIEMRLPAVIMSKKYVNRGLKAPLTRRNLFVRDRYTCQYCGEKKATQDLSFEHVIPKAQGGRTTWTNLVAACLPCNGKKGNRTPEQAGMHLRCVPVHPTIAEMAKASQGRSVERHIPKEWSDFVSGLSEAYWTGELEP